tara:strand:- start:911 stop:1156 length:246 start_codon:yes stop_codon:yes gene_type:complete
VRLAVFRRHGADPESAQLMPEHGYTDQAAGVEDHLIDRLRGGLLRGHDEISFIFAVLVVRHNDHTPRCDVLNRFGNWIKSC